MNPPCCLCGAYFDLEGITKNVPETGPIQDFLSCNGTRVEWIEHFHAVGRDDFYDLKPRAYLTGPGHVFRRGNFEAVANKHAWGAPDNHYSRDTNDLTVWDESEGRDLMVLPFHYSCYHILARAAGFYRSADQAEALKRSEFLNRLPYLDVEAFYQAIMVLYDRYATSQECEIGLDYREFRDQNWGTDLQESELPFILDPVRIPEVQRHIDSLSSTTLQNEAPGSVPIAASYLVRLPTELFMQIADDLSFSAMYALLQAYNYDLKISNAWWLRRARKSMPWLWELKDIPTSASDVRIAELLSQVEVQTHEDGAGTAPVPPGDIPPWSIHEKYEQIESMNVSHLDYCLANERAQAAGMKPYLYWGGQGRWEAQTRWDEYKQRKSIVEEGKAESVPTPGFRMPGLSNRRRIWNACTDELVNLFLQHENQYEEVYLENVDLPH